MKIAGKMSIFDILGALQLEMLFYLTFSCFFASHLTDLYIMSSQTSSLVCQK